MCGDGVEVEVVELRGVEEDEDGGDDAVGKDLCGGLVWAIGVGVSH